MPYGLPQCHARCLSRFQTLKGSLRLVVTCLALTLLFGPAQAAESESLKIAKAVSNAVADVAEGVLPQVVSINATRKVKTNAEMLNEMPKGLPEEFRRFFEDQPERPRRKVEGQGSGFILDAQGRILTNFHVIEDAFKITVQLQNKQEFEAEIVGTDEKTDLAVIQLKNFTGSLPVAKLGDSSKVRVGNLVIAVGAPFGLRESVTLGAISGKDRSMGVTMYEEFLQTDASINPGNSGGPLVNLDGEVIGINTLIHSRSGGNEGVGFAVPINLAKDIIAALIKDGKVTRGWLGVGIQDVDAEIAGAIEGLPNVAGVLVRQVYAETPAGKAGMQAGDVILTYEGETVADSRELQKKVAHTKIDSVVEMVVLRNAKKVPLQVTIAKQPEDLAAFDDDTKEEVEAEEATTFRHEGLGLEVQDLTAALKKQFQAYQNEQGVLVTSVAPDSPAESAGIEQGALVMAINQKPVRNLEEFKAQVEALDPKKPVLVLFRQGNANRFEVLKLEAE